MLTKASALNAHIQHTTNTRDAQVECIVFTIINNKKSMLLPYKIKIKIGPHKL